MPLRLPVHHILLQLFLLLFISVACPGGIFRFHRLYLRRCLMRWLLLFFVRMGHRYLHPARFDELFVEWEASMRQCLNKSKIAAFR
jgi:hypothetical protein